MQPVQPCRLCPRSAQCPCCPFCPYCLYCPYDAPTSARKDLRVFGNLSDLSLIHI